ncbi:hypothetical protein F5Y06DRAFT_303040 [Hypoxylon sp. FL0890]|nr:hypothetical protein F5Y06DRAFT_303040 [Hypoxylon sp. FL0890]
MNNAPRPPSRIYLEKSDLEDILLHLSEATLDQETHTIAALENERNSLQRDLAALKIKWAATYDIMRRTSSTIEVLMGLVQTWGSRMKTERRKWMANSTVAITIN